MEKYYIVNSEGEIIQDLGENIDNAIFTRLDENDIVRKRGIGIGKEETKELNLDFAKFNYKAGMELYKRCPQILMILPYINYEDNYLKYGNGTLVTATNFSKHTGYNKDYVAEVFRKLRNNKIIEMTKINGKYVYIVNPYVVMRGKKMIVSTINKFENTDWQLLGQKRRGNKDGKRKKKSE